jgi:hypothetical protein
MGRPAAKGPKMAKRERKRRERERERERERVRWLSLFWEELFWFGATR